MTPKSSKEAMNMTGAGQQVPSYDAVTREGSEAFDCNVQSMPVMNLKQVLNAAQ